MTVSQQSRCHRQSPERRDPRSPLGRRERTLVSHVRTSSRLQTSSRQRAPGPDGFPAEFSHVSKEEKSLGPQELPWKLDRKENFSAQHVKPASP